MNIDELKRLLSQRENCEIEYKTAKGGFPNKAFWPTYSSFGNTNGGVVVLGVKEVDSMPVVDNLTEDEVEKLKRDYWSTLNDGQKVNCVLTFEEDVKSYELEGGAWVLAIRIPRADYYQKPIYLNGNPMIGTYKRRNEGDFHCTEAEVRQMMSDANLQRSTADARILRNFTMEDIDQSSLAMFRREFRAAKGNHAWVDLSDIEFLKRIGGYRVDRVTGEEGFTVAGMLMFGKEDSITDAECAPDFFVDYREHLTEIDGERWSDRIYPNGRWNANLYLFFVKVLDRLYDALPNPFRLAADGKTRLEYTSAHIAVREALANSIIHASYTQKGNIVVERWKDRIEVSNPGNMLVSVKQFYIGQQSICRNNCLQKMFVALGIGEKAGSGADTIVKGWIDNEWEKPLIEEQYDPDRVRMVLKFTKQSLSIHQAVTKPDEVDSLSWNQAATKLSLSWKQVATIMRMMQEETLAKELRQAMGMKDSTHFKKTILDPMLGEGIIAMTSPDKPTSPNQMYFLTEKGRAILACEQRRLAQPSGVSDEKVRRLIREMDEALPSFPIGLPKMDGMYAESLPVTDVRCFQAAYKMRKEMFAEEGSWIYMTPELYLNEIQGNIWQHYNVQFLMHKAEACYTIRFSEIKEAFRRLGLNGDWTVITSFGLGTFDDLYGGDVRFTETDFGYRYGDMDIYRVPSHEAHLIVMRREHLPRVEPKVFEGDNPEYALINERHLLYSNLFNMKDEGDGYGLAMLRDIRFYYPSEADFRYVKLVVDRLDKVVSDLDGIDALNGI